MTATRILLVDDNPSMREAISIIFEDEPDLDLCGEARGVTDAVEQCASLQPDMALVDIAIVGGDGIDLIRRLRQCAPAVDTVVYSLHDEPFYIDAAREAGASGYVIKSEPPREMLACLRQVRAGRVRFPDHSP